MVKLKKVVSFALAALMLASVVSLTSCSKKNDGTLTIGVDDSYPPMEYQDESGNTVGFDVDLATELGKRINMDVHFQSTNWNGIFTALESKKYDSIISSVSITPERQKTYLMTKPYIANSQIILVKKGDNSIKAINDLKNVNVCCQIQTTANDSADTLIKKGITMHLQTYDKIIECFEALQANKVKALIVDQVVGEYYIKKSPSIYQKLNIKLTNEPIGICFRKDEKALHDKVQKALDAMQADGTMKKLSKKWFNKDLVSNIDTKFKELK